MTRTRGWMRGLAAAALAGAALAWWTASAKEAPHSPNDAEQAMVAQLARNLAAELASACPLGDAASQKAFEACRQALFPDSLFKRTLAPHVLWGRQAADPATPLKETRLTQFVPEVYTGIYLPIFMFDGTAQVTWVEQEKLYRIKLGAAFRNRLPPGLFPYPFWHDPAKWSAYENANGLLVWVSPSIQPQIRVVQFTWQDGPLAGVTVRKAEPPRFDGRWLWTDGNGRTQPAVTLFDGLYSERNPHKADLDSRYRELAGALRQGQCMDCHVPSNPGGLRRLVLLQTPVHAAGEIGRILKTVRSGRMPVDELGVEHALPDEIRQALIRKGEAFEAAVTAAARWEADKRLETPSSPSP